MNAVVVLPIWTLILLVAAPPFAGWLGARQGAKKAIALCSAHWGCAMKQDEERAKTTQDLEEQLRKLRAEHPEFKQASEAMRKVLAETGEHPAVLERRAQQDKDQDGHK